MDERNGRVWAPRDTSLPHERSDEERTDPKRWGPRNTTPLREVADADTNGIRAVGPARHRDAHEGRRQSERNPRGRAGEQC